MTDDPFAKAINDMLDSAIGVDAVYTPAIGDPIPIRCFFNKEYAAQMGMEGHTINIEALTSVIGAAKPGETIYIANEEITYKIKEPPHAGDDGMSVVELSID